MIAWKDERLYLVREVAHICGRSISQVHTWIQQGKLTARLVAGVRYIAETEIDRFLGIEEAGPVVLKTTPALEREAAKETADMRRRGAI